MQKVKRKGKFLGILLAFALVVAMLPVFPETAAANVKYDSLRVIPDACLKTVSVYAFNSETLQGMVIDPSKYTVQFKGNTTSIEGTNAEAIAAGFDTVYSALASDPEATSTVTATLTEAVGSKNIGDKATGTFLPGGLYSLSIGFDIHGNANQSCIKVGRIELLPYAGLSLAYDHKGHLIPPGRVADQYYKREGHVTTAEEINGFPTEPGDYTVYTLVAFQNDKYEMNAMGSHYYQYFTIDENGLLVSGELSEGAIVVDPIAKSVTVKTQNGSVVPAESYTLAFEQKTINAGYISGGSTFPTSQGTWRVVATAKDDSTYTGTLTSDDFVVGGGRFAGITVDPVAMTVAVTDTDGLTFDPTKDSDSYSVGFFEQQETNQGIEDNYLGEAFPTEFGTYVAVVKSLISGDEDSMISSLPFTVPVDAAKFTATITEVSVGAVATGEDEEKYVPVVVTFTGTGDVSEFADKHKNIEFLESMATATLSGTDYNLGTCSTTLMEVDTDDALAGATYPSYKWSTSTKTGKMKLNVPVLDSVDVQGVEVVPGYGYSAVNGVVNGDTMNFWIETYLRDGQIVKSNLATVPLEINSLPKTYMIEPKATVVEAPTISGETSFTTTTEVTITGPSGSEIYYTDDGTTPTTSSAKYTEAITLTETKTIKAIAAKGKVTSEVATKTFTKESSGGGGGGYSGGGSTGGGGGGYSGGGNSGGSANPGATDSKTTTPVTEKTTNADGSVTETTKTTNADGSKTETQKTTAKDGTVTEMNITVMVDGSKTETQKTTATDGTVTETQKKLASDGSGTISETVTAKDGSVNTSSVTLGKDGKATSIVNSSITKDNDMQTFSFAVKGKKASVSLVETTSKKVTISSKITAADGNTYNVSSISTDAFEGMKFKELNLPASVKNIEPDALKGTKLKTLNVSGKKIKLGEGCLKKTDKKLVINVSSKKVKKSVESQLAKAGNPTAKVKVSKKK